MSEGGRMKTLALARAVLAKELVDGLRDRRTVAMALVFPLLGPIVLAASFSMVSSQARSAEEEGVKLPVVGAEHAPALVAFLAEAGIAAEPPPEDPEGAVRRGDAEVVLIVPAEFGERLRAGQPAPVRLVVDESRRMASRASERVQARLEAWASRTAAQRLVLRGVHPLVTAPLAIEIVDVSTPESRAALLFSVMPYFLVMAVFMGGMAVAIDTTAGERERHSLEPLLANPVPRAALVLGKVGASSFFSLLALAETSIAFALVPVFLSPEKLGLSLRLDPGVVARIFVLTVPLLLAANALMILVASRARSFRAAQTTLSFLMLVPAIPGFILALTPVKVQPWMQTLPALAEQLVMVKLLRGEAVGLGDAARAMTASLVLAVVLLVIAVRDLERGKVLFDR
jgi:sodium transport system permease protein